MSSACPSTEREVPVSARSLGSIRLQVTRVARSVAMLACLVIGADAQMLVQYDPVGGPNGGQTYSATFVASSITATDLMQVNFVGGWSNTNVWPVGQIGVASPNLDPTQYVTFDVSSAMPMQYLTLSYSKNSYVGEGAQQAAVRSSIDGFANDVDSVTGLNPSGFDQIQFDLSRLPAWSGTISFRIYFYDALVTGSDWVDLVSSTNPLASGVVLTGVEAGVIDLCTGDGGDQMGCSDCPCGNNSPAGTRGGCLHSGGMSSELRQLGTLSIANADLRFEASGVAPAHSCILISGASMAPVNAANPCFGMDSGIGSLALDGLRCTVQGILRHGVRSSDANGDVGITTPGWGGSDAFPQFAAFTSGDTRYFQIYHTDDPSAVCQTGLNTTQAASVTFLP